MSPLILSHSGLRKLDPQLQTLSIESIELNRNYLSSLRGVPRNVQRLDAKENYLVEHGLLVSLPFLRSLDASQNDIDFSHGIYLHRWFPSLEILRLSSNLLSTCHFLNELPLKELFIDDNCMTILENLPPSLEVLNASSNNIRIVQSRLPSHLKSLVLSSNTLQFGGLPLYWGTCLQMLNLYNNRIEKFPKNLPDTLHTLVLSHNELTELPSQLPSSLKVLNVNSNRIRSLPNYRLDILHIADNCLTVDPNTSVVKAKVIQAEDNWTQEKHHKMQRKIQTWWRRCVLTLRLRHYRRTQRTKEELFMVSMSPERWQQIDSISLEWFTKVLNRNRIDHHSD